MSAARCALALTQLGRRVAAQRQRDSAHSREVLGGRPLGHAARVFVQHHVEGVMQVVLDGLFEGWSCALVAERLLWLGPSLAPEHTLATLHCVARERARLGPLEATRAVVRTVLAEASRAI